MTPEDIRTVINFESFLIPGVEVMVNWTSSGRSYRSLAKIVKVNRASIQVELLRPTISYPAGTKITVPRLSFGRSNRWSAGNRIEPCCGYRFCA